MLVANYKLHKQWQKLSEASRSTLPHRCSDRLVAYYFGLRAFEKVDELTDPIKMTDLSTKGKHCYAAHCIGKLCALAGIDNWLHSEKWETLRKELPVSYPLVELSDTIKDLSKEE